jgi:hypothetical protein
MFLLLWSLGKRAEILPPKLEDLQFVGYIKSGSLLTYADLVQSF